MRKKEKKDDKRSFRERFADSFEVSKEIFLDVPKLVFLGDRELTIENYKGFVEYTDTVLVLETNSCRLKIDGENLEVGTISTEMLYIKGIIHKVEFRKEK